MENSQPQRKGACNWGACSACCRFLLVPIFGPWSWPKKGRVIVKTPPSAAWRELLRVRGARLIGNHAVILYDGQIRSVDWKLHIDTVCPQLTEEGTCALYGKPERPDACNTFPAFPEALEELPMCTFSFEGEAIDSTARG